MVERVLVLTDHTCTTNGIRLKKHLDTELPAVMVDRHMMEQVLMNLVLNAVHAMKGGGVLMIRTRTAENQCVIEVEDTGCGIPTHVLPRIFDPFFTTKSPGEGTGLGLSVSLGIVERHGGQLRVESEVGKGSIFTVWLPLTKTRAPVERVV
jgi:signal transduction histidine kinase